MQEGGGGDALKGRVWVIERLGSQDQDAIRSDADSRFWFLDGLTLPAADICRHLVPNLLCKILRRQAGCGGAHLYPAHGSQRQAGL